MSKSESERGPRSDRKSRVGRVVSDAMNKTVVVEVGDAKAHSGYGKIVRRDRRFMAHDENNETKLGDTVRIDETRPLSKMKRWRVVEIVERAK